MDANLKVRADRYFALSNRLAHVDNREIELLLGEPPTGSGWGTTHVITLAGAKIFVKRIPLTDIEFDNQFSTANLFEMPTFYNYGVGSAGFGAFRELVANIKTTNWVLAGEAFNLPLTYHYRIVPSTIDRSGLIGQDPERLAGYIKYWNSDPNIERYMQARRVAKHDLVIFLEYFPHVLYSWLPKNSSGWESVIRETRDTIGFLQRNGIIHFDAHFANILVDSVGRPYLTDFGLVLDKNFALTAKEKEFFHRHLQYDEAQFLSGVGSYLHSAYHQQPARTKTRLERKYGFAKDAPFVEAMTALLENLEQIHADNWMKLTDFYVDHVIANRPLTLTMARFYTRLRQSDSKGLGFPHTKIRRLLRDGQ